MSRPFAAVESFLERILERPAARLFHAHPQPVQLERRIERAMSAHKMVRGGHAYVPSRYRIVLNPADLVALQEASDQLPDDLAEAILLRARSQGYWLVARPEVLLVPSERIIQGDLEVDAEPLDPSLVSSAAAGLRPVGLEGPRPPRPPIPGTGVVPDPVPLPGIPAQRHAPDDAVPPVPPSAAAAPPPAAPPPAAPPPAAPRPVLAPDAERVSAVVSAVPVGPIDARTVNPSVPQESAVPPPDAFLVVPVAGGVAPPPSAAGPVAVHDPGVPPDMLLDGHREAGPVAVPPPEPMAVSDAGRTPVAVPVVVTADPTVAAHPTLGPEPSTPEPVVRAVIEVRAPDRPPASVVFQGGSVRVGRGTDNEIVILDERVSRHHGRFAARHGVLVYTDLDSTNGSLVNGLRVREAGLGVGDVVRLGRTTLTVRPHP